MIKVIGVRFRRAGKVYYFNPLDMDITTGMHVIVETARGVEYGYVVLGVKDMDEEKVFQPLKPVIRIATPQDDAVADENRQKEKDAFKICHGRPSRRSRWCGLRGLYPRCPPESLCLPYLTAVLSYV